jgi:hypothetical protein
VAVLDIVVLLGLILQNPSAGEPQAKPSTSAEPRDPSLDRIRSRLQEPPAITVPKTPDSLMSSNGRPLFQVHVEASLMSPWDWLPTGPVPTYVRPTYTLTHHEFMLSVTPEVFRGVSTHPYGVPVMSVGRAIAKATRGPLKRRREAKARKEVDEALAAFYAATGQSAPAQKTKQ